MEFKLCMIGDTVYGDTNFLNEGFMSPGDKEYTGLFEGEESHEIPFYFEDKRLKNLEDGLVDDKFIDF